MMDRPMAAAIAILMTTCALFATPSSAAPKDKRAKAKGTAEEQSRSSRVKVDFRGGGPPPWAPAHGYRGRGGSTLRADATYIAPFHLDLGRCNRGALGAALGGAAGGVLGSKIGDGAGRDAATIAGAIIGVMVGQSVGQWMDGLDQACVGQVLEHTPSGRPVEWANPDNGVVYQVTPAETYRLGGDRYCREFQAEAQIGSQTRRVSGTACRHPDGSWEAPAR